MARKAPKTPQLRPLTPIQRAQMGNLPSRPLPDRPLTQVKPVKVAQAPVESNLKQTLGELGQVAGNALSLSPLSLHPVGFAIGAGATLGGLATAAMHAHERSQPSPKQRAERDYGKGIEARIMRRGKGAQ